MLSQRFLDLAADLRRSQAARPDGPGMMAIQVRARAGLIGLLAQRAASFPDVAAFTRTTAERLHGCTTLSPADVAELAAWAERMAQRCRRSEDFHQAQGGAA